jgi:hypothetical protein
MHVTDEKIFLNIESSESITSLEFSHCGKYYVAAKEHELPVIGPLPFKDGGELPTNEVELVTRPAPKRRKLDVTVASANETAALTMLHQARLMEANSCVVDAENGTLTSLEHGEGISLAHHDLVAGGISRTRVLKLPGDINPNNTATTLISSDRNQLKVILNSKQQSTYNSDEVRYARDLPAVIDKKIDLVPSEVGPIPGRKHFLEPAYDPAEVIIQENTQISRKERHKLANRILENQRSWPNP